MRSLGSRRVVQVAGAATVAVIALAGCSAGQTAETALLQTPIAGLNTMSPDGGLLIRNLQVVYSDPSGYPANGSAPIEVSLVNQTHDPITVTVGSRVQQDVVDTVVSAQQVGLTGGSSPSADASESASPSESPSGTPSSTPSGSAGATPTGSAGASPSGSASPSADTTSSAAPAKITIAPLSSAIFQPGGSQTLSAIGLSNKLAPGYQLALTFQVGSGAPIDVLAPVAIPLSPAERAPVATDEAVESDK